MSLPNSAPPSQRLHPLFLPRNPRPKRTATEAALGLIPFPRIATYNVNSLSQYANTSDSLARRHNIITNIKELLKQADIVCLQETRLLPNDHGALCGALPSCRVLHAPGVGRRAGVAVVVNLRYHEANIVTNITPAAQRRLEGQSSGGLLHPVRALEGPPFPGHKRAPCAWSGARGQETPDKGHQGLACSDSATHISSRRLQFR